MSESPRHKSIWSAKRRKDLLNEIILWIVMLIFFVPALWIILTSVLKMYWAYPLDTR